MYTHVFRYCRSIDRFNQLGRNPCRSPVRLDRVTCWPPISSPSKVKHTWPMVSGATHGVILFVKITPKGLLLTILDQAGLTWNEMEFEVNCSDLTWIQYKVWEILVGLPEMSYIWGRLPQYETTKLIYEGDEVRSHHSHRIIATWNTSNSRMTGMIKIYLQRLHYPFPSLGGYCHNLPDSSFVFSKEKTPVLSYDFPCD